MLFLNLNILCTKETFTFLKKGFILSLLLQLLQLFFFKNTYKYNQFMLTSVVHSVEMNEHDQKCIIQPFYEEYSTIQM